MSHFIQNLKVKYCPTIMLSADLSGRLV